MKRTKNKTIERWKTVRSVWSLILLFSSFITTFIVTLIFFLTKTNVFNLKQKWNLVNNYLLCISVYYILPIYLMNKWKWFLNLLIIIYTQLRVFIIFFSDSSSLYWYHQVIIIVWLNQPFLEKSDRLGFRTSYSEKTTCFTIVFP